MTGVDIFSQIQIKKQDLVAIMQKFEAYCNLKKNCFSCLPSETISQYVTELRTGANSCEFGVAEMSII